MVLIVTVVRGPLLRRVAGVLIEDADLPSAVQADLAPPSMTILGPVSLTIFAVR